MREFRTQRHTYTYVDIRVGSKTGESLMATDEQGREVVIKRPSLSNPNPTQRSLSIADLKREQAALETLRRVQEEKKLKELRCLCHLIESGEAEERRVWYQYLVIERAQGKPLPELIQEFRIKGSRLPEGLMLKIMDQLLGVLAAAHQEGILYNDVKDDHLFINLDRDPLLKIIDWGNAVFEAQNKTVTQADDIFQSGLLLYYLVTDESYAPRKGEHKWEPAHLATWELPFRHPVEAGLKVILAKALHPVPSSRYKSAADMRQALREYYEERKMRWMGDRESVESVLKGNTSVSPASAEEAYKRMRSFDPHDPSVIELGHRLESHIAQAAYSRSLSRVLNLIEIGDWENALSEMLSLREDSQRGTDRGVRFLIECAQIVSHSVATKKREGKRYLSDRELQQSKQEASKIVLSAYRSQEQAHQAINGMSLDKVADLSSPYNALLGALCRFTGCEVVLASLGQTYRAFYLEKNRIENLLHTPEKWNGTRKEKWEYYYHSLRNNRLIDDVDDLVSTIYLSENSHQPQEPRGSCVHTPKDIAQQYKLLAAKLDELQKSLLEYARDIIIPDQNDFFVSVERSIRVLEDIQSSLNRAEEYHGFHEGKGEERFKQFRTHILKAREVDPHHLILSTLETIEQQIATLQNYDTRIAAKSSPDAFEDWLEKWRVSLASILNRGQDVEIHAKLKAVETWIDIWKAVRKAAQEPDVVEMRKGLKDLSDKVRLNKSSQNLIDELDFLRELAWEKPWRFIPGTSEARDLDDLARSAVSHLEEKTEFTKAINLARNVATHEVERAWIEYYEQLHAAAQHLSLGDYEKSYAELQKSRLKHRQCDYEFLDMCLSGFADLIYKGHSPSLQDIHEQYRATYLYQQLKSHSDQLPDIKKGLGIYHQDPIRAGEQLIYAEPWFRPKIIDVVNNSRIYKGALEKTLEGRFVEAKKTFESLNSLSRYPILGVNVNTPSPDYLQDCWECLEKILHEYRNPNPNLQLVNWQRAGAQLDAIVNNLHKMSICQGKVCGRPQAWLSIYQQLKKPIKDADYGGAIRIVDASGVLYEQIAPYFKWIQDWARFQLSKKDHDKPGPGPDDIPKRRLPWYGWLLVFMVPLTFMCIATCRILNLVPGKQPTPTTSPTPAQNPPESFLEPRIVEHSRADLCAELDTAARAEDYEEIQTLIAGVDDPAWVCKGLSIAQIRQAVEDYQNGMTAFKNSQYEIALEDWGRVPLIEGWFPDLIIFKACAKYQATEDGSSLDTLPADALARVPELCGINLHTEYPDPVTAVYTDPEDQAGTTRTTNWLNVLDKFRDLGMLNIPLLQDSLLDYQGDIWVLHLGKPDPSPNPMEMRYPLEDFVKLLNLESREIIGARIKLRPFQFPGDYPVTTRLGIEINSQSLAKPVTLTIDASSDPDAYSATFNTTEAGEFHCEDSRDIYDYSNLSSVTDIVIQEEWEAATDQVHLRAYIGDIEVVACHMGGFTSPPQINLYSYTAWQAEVVISIELFIQ